MIMLCDGEQIPPGRWLSEEEVVEWVAKCPVKWKA